MGKGHPALSLGCIWRSVSYLRPKGTQERSASPRLNVRSRLELGEPHPSQALSLWIRASLISRYQVPAENCWLKSELPTLFPLAP